MDGDVTCWFLFSLSLLETKIRGGPGIEFFFFNCVIKTPAAHAKNVV